MENTSHKLSLKHHLFKLNYKGRKGSQSVTVDLYSLAPQLTAIKKKMAIEQHTAKTIHFNQQQ